jgi:hypothetical protein
MGRPGKLASVWTIAQLGGRQLLILSASRFQA